MNDLFGMSSAVFSEDRRHRYELWRWWQKEKRYAMFIGLNPSTADETLDDPTIRRCINFSKDWGYGGLCMTNIFGIRTTYPDVMKKDEDPIGPDNDEHLIKVAKDSGIIIAAWGVHGEFLNRGIEVAHMLKSHATRGLMCLGQTSNGFPKHPLYIKRNVIPTAYEWGD